MPDSALQAITDDQFKAEVLQAPTLVVVDFWGRGCHPCVAIGRILESLAPKYFERVKFVKINTDKYQRVATEYGLRAIPTLLFFDQGTLVQQIQGYQEQNEIQRIIDRLLRTN